MIYLEKTKKKISVIIGKESGGNTVKVYLIRHGETDWNKVKKIQGSSNIDLNEYGRELARITANALKETPFDIAYSSPLKRARETADLILEGRDIPIYEDPCVQEAHFGIFEGRVQKELEDEHSPFMKFFTAPQQFVEMGGVEKHEEIMKRAADFYKDKILKAEGVYENIAVFSHGAWIHALLTTLYNREVKDFWHAPRQENCGVSAIEVKDGNSHVLYESKIYYESNDQVSGY